MGTPLGAASWTLAIEVQAYALFPLIARGTMKKPALTLGIMCAVCFGFRAWCLWALTDYSMVVNQLVNFLDVYVAGILTAIAYIRLSERQDTSGNTGSKTYVWQAAASILFAAALFGLLKMIRFQASSGEYTLIQRRQMIYRPAYALFFSMMILSAPFTLLPLRKLLGNPVTKFLGGISMNYYLIHQTVIIHLKRLRIPPSVSDTPNTAGEQPWQSQYTLMSFGISLLLAVFVTYAIEKPAARAMDRIREKRRLLGSSCRSG